MIIREAKPDEVEGLLIEGYKEWPKNRSLDQYIKDNREEDAFGTRYVLEAEGEIVCSFILLRFKSYMGKCVYGIGSVLTPEKYRKKGYAHHLLKACLAHLPVAENIIYLYSDVSSEFYEKLSFKVLPSHFQTTNKSTAMIKCSDEVWREIVSSNGNMIPPQF